MFKGFLPIICVLMFFIFHSPNLGYTHPNDDHHPQKSIDEYNGYKASKNNIEKFLGPTQTKLVESKLVIADLNSSWQANEAAIRENRNATITKALSTFIGAIAAIPTAGTGTAATLIAFGPTFISAADTYKSATESEQMVQNRESYIQSFEKALTGFDAAVAYHKAEYDKYTSFYNKYLEMEASLEHDGGLFVKENGAVVGPLTKDDLYSKINGSTQKYFGYYHRVDSQLKSDHTMDTHLDRDILSVTPLPSKYLCPGECNNSHRSAYDAYATHLKSCADYSTTTFTNSCGVTWYSCESNHTEKEKSHHVSTCFKYIVESLTKKRPCNAEFKSCIRVLFDHDETDSDSLGTIHSVKSLDDGENRQSEDGTTTSTTSTSTTHHACSAHLTSESGSHSSASCGTSGHYVCDGSSHVSASCGESGHYACDSKTHTAAVCGTSGHYDCDNENHSMQVSCTTHSTCEVINFYACDNHDPAVTCAYGHSYNPTIAGEVNTHRTRTCRYSECRQTWQKCVSSAPICNKPYRKRNGMSCWAID